jgi:hypothetical protein
VLQSGIRDQLLHGAHPNDEQKDDGYELDEEYVNSGTSQWDDFANFVFSDDGIEFLFSPYQVAAYAFGPQFATIAYNQVAKLMHRHYAFALGIEYLQRDQPFVFSESDSNSEPEAHADESSPHVSGEDGCADVISDGTDIIEASRIADESSATAGLVR